MTLALPTIGASGLASPAGGAGGGNSAAAIEAALDRTGIRVQPTGVLLSGAAQTLHVLSLSVVYGGSRA